MQNFLFGFLALAMTSFPQPAPDDKAAASTTPGETKRVRGAIAPPVKQNTLRVPRMKDTLTIDADWNKAAWKGVTPVTLEYYMGQEPEHQPKVEARLAYDDDFLYVIWKVADNYVLAKRTKHQQDVWRDSCVELFFTPGGDPTVDPTKRGYFNLETNCTGVKLCGVHFPGAKDDKLTDEDFASIVTASSLKGPIDPELAKPTTWTLEYKIPFSVLEKFTKVERPRTGVKWRANLYKCADDASHPHWLTWSPITLAEPSFHQPRFFGMLAFE